MVAERSEPPRGNGIRLESDSALNIQGERTKGGDLDRTMATGGAGSSPLEQDSIGKYEIRKLLGQGGMGAVYLGFDPLIEREVAIKVLPPSLAENETNLKRFLAEARAVGKLNHSNAIAIYDIGQHEGKYFIVMELARGGSVSELLEKKRHLPLKEAGRIILQAAEGLAAAHAVGLVHRDVKPENLMLSSEGVVKLVDFGLAKDVGRGSEMAMTSAGQLLGTPYYMSPEQINGEKIDHRTDIYSLGATFHHLMTGEVPFRGDSITKVLIAHVNGPRPDPRKLDPTLPEDSTGIVAKALSIEPKERFATMQEFADAVRKLLEQSEDDAREIRGTQTVAIENATPRILIVEPSKLRSKVTADVFRKAGCQTISCITDPSEAIRLAEKESFDVVVASRQLGDSMGEDVLRRMHESPATGDFMSVLVSSDAPDKVLDEARLDGNAAYVKKQARPDEVLRAVLAGLEPSLLRATFAEGDRQDATIDVVTSDGTIPDDLAGWIRELGVLDVTARSTADLESATFGGRDLILLLLETDAGGASVGDQLVSPQVTHLLEHFATVAIVLATSSGMRLRGVRRAAFLACCNRAFDREALEYVIDAAR